MRFVFRRYLALLMIAGLVPAVASGKPIAFGDGWTFMHERDSDMIETDLYYAPTHWFSFGPTISIARSDDGAVRREANVLHANFLAKRWNWSHAQGNVFTSYGLGKVKTIFKGSTLAAVDETAHHAVIQGDFETRQFYSSFKFDVHRTNTFFDRVDTLQIGASPVAHDYEDLAVWFVAQVKKYRGLNAKTEPGAFVRVFRKNIWVELGVTEGRKAQMMFMFNY